MTSHCNAAIRRPRTDADYIPAHLRRFVFHSQDDFYISRHFHPLLLIHLMYEGFLPIASEFQDQCFLLPKLHRQRCVLLFKPETPEHVPKIVRKRAKKYKFVLNRDFDSVVTGCHEKHGVPWLYPSIVETFKTLYKAGKDTIELCPGINVRLFTVELYDVATDTLVAGELGYTVGSIYTSLTGFSRANGAGTVQLHALSKFLYLAGFKMWDLGMSMEYKMSLGAKDCERDEFLDLLYRWRHEQVLMKLDEKMGEDDVSVGGVMVKNLFGHSRPPTGTAAKSKDATRGQQKKDIAEEKTGEMKDVNDGKDQEDATDEKREAGAKRKLSVGHRQQKNEDQEGRSDADARPTIKTNVLVKKNANKRLGAN
ncbi:unnamed protein product [Peronospora belbahrii]|uniref:Leucyl/phenylalanyl-tRNA--protein transferase n=1 Tax=Peronospora belbahrii TaxID=622444 RepID=A0AAU9L4G2_9STRA|nr:unnamed protein product [Peronospora belbahrii]CAH0519230.1 unnamed protein product [Peronospora belbahrii]